MRVAHGKDHVCITGMECGYCVCDCVARRRSLERMLVCKYENGKEITINVIVRCTIHNQ